MITEPQTMTAADRRQRRYLRWWEQHGPAATTVAAVCFRDALDNASFLLSDHDMDRLLAFLQHLDAAGRDVFPLPMTDLPHDTIVHLATRQIAQVLERPEASLDEMTEMWGRDPWAGEQPFRRWLIDAGLDLTQMHRLNDVPGIRVVGTCAGHQEIETDRSSPYFPTRGPCPGFGVRVRGPWGRVVAAHLARVLRDATTDTTTSAFDTGVSVRCRVPNTPTNADTVRTWWDTAISRLEAATMTSDR